MSKKATRQTEEIQNRAAFEAQARIDAKNAARAEQHIDSLLEGGHINADEETMAYAREQLIRNPEKFLRFATREKPEPAITKTIDPNSAKDPTEQAIQNHMKTNGTAYHEAAREIATKIRGES